MYFVGEIYIFFLLHHSLILEVLQLLLESKFLISYYEKQINKTHQIKGLQRQVGKNHIQTKEVYYLF